MTVYRSRYRQRLRRLRLALLSAGAVQLAGHALTALGGAVGGVGLALGQGALVLMGGGAVLLGLSVATGASELSQRWRRG